MRDSQGGVRQFVPLSKEAAKAWKEYIRVFDAEFRRAFGRSRRRGERLDSGSYFERNGAFTDEVSEAMEAAGADPAWIYAFQRTGLFVTEMNERLIPMADLKRWRSAVTEYRTGAVRRRQAVYDRALQHLFEEYLKYPFIVAKFVGEAIAPKRSDSDVARFQRQYLLFCATKAVKTHKAVSLLIREQLPEDLMSLARSVYETYLHMVWALIRPQDAHAVSAAKIGLMTGTHEFEVTRNGRINRRAVVDKRTGVVQPMQIAMSQLAELSTLAEDGAVHQGLYSLLSQHVHPDYRSVFHYMDDEGFSPREEAWLMPAITIAITAHLMVADALLQSPIKLSRTTEDLRQYVRRAKKRFTRVTELAIQSGATSHLPSLLQQRVERVGERWLQPSV